MLSLVASADSASNASANGALLSLVAGSGLLFAVFDCPLSFVIGSSPLAVVLGRFLSFIAGNSPLSTVFDCFLSSVTGGGLLSAILGHFLSLIADGGHLSPVFGSGSLSLMLFASSRALFLTSILSYVHCSSLPSLPLFYSSLPFLPILLTCNPISLTEKRLFD